MSSVHDTSTAKMSQSSAEMTIPFLFKKFSPFRNNLLQFRQLVATKTVIARQTNRHKPELRETPGVVYMNVRGLGSFLTVKEKPVTANPQHRRHDASVPRDVFGSEAESFPTPWLKPVWFPVLSMISGGVQRNRRMLGNLPRFGRSARVAGCV